MVQHMPCMHENQPSSLARRCGSRFIRQSYQSYFGFLNDYFHNSKREVQAILKDVFNLLISLGLICNTTKRVSKRLEKPYQELQKEVLASPYVHIDETGHRHKGQRGWAWIVTSKRRVITTLNQKIDRYADPIYCGTLSGLPTAAIQTCPLRGGRQY